MNKTIIGSTVLALTFHALAWSQAESISLTHATIHLGTGTVLNDATVTFANGKIASVSNEAQPASTRVIDCKGKHIYPGLIALDSTLGLVEFESTRATIDTSETGRFNPNARALVAYNTDSQVIPTIRSEGILFAQIAPRGGVFSGTSALVKLDAWNWEDALIDEGGVWLNWPSLLARPKEAAGSAKEKPAPAKGHEEYDRLVLEVLDFLKEAKSYAAMEQPTKTNLRFEATKGLFDNTAKLFVRVDRAREIADVIKMSKDLGIKTVVVGGAEADLKAKELADASVSVVVRRTHSLPLDDDADIYQAFRLPHLLHKAGVTFALCVAGEFTELRNLPFAAGTAAAFGLAKEEALRAITLDAARILGVDSRIGSIEVGKDASLVVTTGDILDPKSATVEMAFLEGLAVDLNNKQKDLYQKFKKKLNL